MSRLLKGLGVGLVLFMLAGCQTMTGETAGQNLDDSSVTASVKTQLAADRAENLTRVSVTTVKGTVYLAGTVDSSQEKARAEELASHVRGVRRVVNNLQVAQR